MRILLINQVFYPDVAATAQHAHDLARHLVRHGHEVHVIASRAIYGTKGAALPKRETVDGIHIHRVARAVFGKAGIFGRMIDFGLFYAAAGVKALFMKRFDVVVCLTTPPFIVLVGWVLRLLKRSKLVFWVMDMYPDVPVALGVMKPKSLATRFFDRIDRWMLRSADRTVVLGRCMMERVRAKIGAGHPAEHVVRIGVWSDQGEVRPIARDENPYRKEWGLGDRFVVMYSGNFGLAHDVDTMLRACEMLNGDDRFRFVFAGGGKKKAVVEKFVKDKGLTNAVCAPYQPREKLDASLSVADAHLVSVLEGLEGMIVPCKLFGIMAAGRPTMYIGNASSEIARVVEERDCGVLIGQGDAEGLVTAIRAMADDAARTRAMGQNARNALGEAFDRERACEQWRELLESLISPGRPAASTPASSKPEHAKG